MHTQADNGHHSERWVKMGFKLRCSFVDFLKRTEKMHMKDGHIKPQINHLPLQVDYMLQFETIETDWKMLQGFHNWLPDLPKKNVTEYDKDYREYYTDEAYEIVNRIYKADISLWKAIEMRRIGLADVRNLQKTFSGVKAGQMQTEVDAMANLFADNNCQRYLEVGARYGDTFFDVMRRLPKGSRGVCVDLPGGVWGNDGTIEYLKKACNKLEEMGYDIQLIEGDSRDPGIIKKVERFGPFDCALIDADHRYAGVKADYENYAPMCKMGVALHDIAGEGQRHSKGINVEVPRFWKEIKTEGCHEFIGPASQMGIGVKWNT